MSQLQTRRMPESLPLQVRRETISEGSIDTEARTVTLVFTTGAAVRRRRYEGWDTAIPFDEILVVSKAAIDLSRMNAGAPVLDSHSTYTTFSQVGVVERAWIEGKEGKATVRFPAAGIDERADRMFGLVADKIIKNVSVGYSIDKIRVVASEKKGQVEQHIIERWTPSEISFVTVGADAGAQVRAAASNYPIELIAAGRGAGLSSMASARLRMKLAEDFVRSA